MLSRRRQHRRQRVSAESAVNNRGATEDHRSQTSRSDFSRLSKSMDQRSAERGTFADQYALRRYLPSSRRRAARSKSGLDHRSSIITRRIRASTKPVCDGIRDICRPCGCWFTARIIPSNCYARCPIWSEARIIDTFNGATLTLAAELPTLQLLNIWANVNRESHSHRNNHLPNENCNFAVSAWA